jgi:hypothetical protein
VTCLSVPLTASLAETWFVKGMRVAFDGAEILIGRTMRIDVFGVLEVEIEMIPTKVSDVCDEAVEMQNDCPKVTGGARVIYRDVLHGHEPGLFLHRVCKHRARGLGSLSVFCLMSALHLSSSACDLRR